MRSQKMNHLLQETCLCLAVTALLLLGGTVVLILTKAVEGSELLAAYFEKRRRGL